MKVSHIQTHTHTHCYFLSDSHRIQSVGCNIQVFQIGCKLRRLNSHLSMNTTLWFVNHWGEVDGKKGYWMFTRGFLFRERDACSAGRWALLAELVNGQGHVSLRGPFPCHSDFAFICFQPWPKSMPFNTYKRWWPARCKITYPWLQLKLANQTRHQLVNTFPAVIIF